MLPKFQEFVHERKYLLNVSPATLNWYKYSLAWLPNESPCQEDLKNAVLRMREKGLKATGCNSAIRAINAYLKWSGSALKVPQLKEPQLILLTATDIPKLTGWKPQGFHQQCLHLLILTLLDIGSRITETLEIRWSDVDFDNLLLKLHGKGNKDRVVPFSFELRRHLYRWRQKSKYDLVFTTSNGMKLGRRNMLRDVKLLCQELGIKAPDRTIHAFRHTFGANYVRRGGSVFHLQKALGHSKLEMSRRYANLMTEDLQAVHENISLLKRIF